MTSRDFAKAFHYEKENLLDLYFERKQTPNNHRAEVSILIDRLHLDSDQKETLHKMVDSVITDVMYAILLGLDGSGTIGNLRQQDYNITDEEGNTVTDGELGDAAYDIFHGDQSV